MSCKCKLSGSAVRSGVASTNSAGDARAPVIGGLGGLGLPEMEGIFGTPDSSALSQLMQSPGVSQMMQTLLSNPQYLDQVVILHSIRGECLEHFILCIQRA